MLKKILCATLAMGLIGALGDDAFAQETKKKKKKKKKKAPPAGETTDTSGGEGKAAATEATESTETAATAWKAPYGAAGCGLGSIVLGNKPGIIQVFAATTNGTSASQSFGITTGTSNCVGPSSAAAAQIEREVYVDMNFASLSKEAAQGSGEHLTALADIMGCAGSAEDLAAFGRLSQNRYGDIFNAANSKDVATNYVNAVRAEPTLASRCVRAI
jgi:hypothetical protein